MKEVAMNVLFILYSFASMMVLGVSILFPFMVDVKGFPNWIGWILYPLAVIVMASQGKIFQLFREKKVL